MFKLKLFFYKVYYSMYILPAHEFTSNIQYSLIYSIVYSITRFLLLNRLRFCATCYMFYTQEVMHSKQCLVLYYEIMLYNQPTPKFF